MIDKKRLLKKADKYEGLSSFRFCNDKQNYIWVQEYNPSKSSVKLTYHPVASGLVGVDLLQKPALIKELFTKLADTLNDAYKTGKAQKVEYKWSKQCAAAPSDKVSVMMKCTETEGFGGGYWVN